VIQGRFGNSEGAEAVGFSDSNFDLVVEAFDDAAGKLFLRPKVVRDEGAVGTEHLDDLLQQFDPRAHRLITPLIEELAARVGETYSQNWSKSSFRG